jgi:hypothetical protein
MFLGREGSGGARGVGRRANGSGGDVLTVSTMEEGKVTMVHSDVVGCVGKVPIECDRWCGSLKLVPCRGIGRVFIDEE